MGRIITVIHAVPLVANPVFSLATRDTYQATYRNFHGNGNPYRGAWGVAGKRRAASHCASLKQNKPPMRERWRRKRRRIVGSVPLSGEARGTPGKRSGLLTALVYETSGIEPRGKSAGEKSRRKLEARGGEGDLPRALLSFDRTRRYKYFPRSFLPSSFFPGP